MDTLLRLLDELNNLDLSTYPVAKVEAILQKIDFSKMVHFDMPKDFIIYRARPNDPKPFSTRSELSFKPQKCNTTYQRCSTPNKTMFYGCPVSPTSGLPASQDMYPVLAGLFEASNTYRYNKLISEEKITIGRWKTTQPIKVNCIFIPSKIQTNPNYFNHNEVARLINSTTHSDKSLVINEYFGQKFYNSNIRYDYDYLITALLAEHFVNLGFDGVIYPSTKIQGENLNICLTEDCANTKVKLIQAAESVIMKYGYQNEIVHQSFTKIDYETQQIIFKEIKSNAEIDQIWSDLLTMAQFN